MVIVNFKLNTLADGSHRIAAIDKLHGALSSARHSSTGQPIAWKWSMPPYEPSDHQTARIEIEDASEAMLIKLRWQQGPEAAHFEHTMAPFRR